MSRELFHQSLVDGTGTTRKGKSVAVAFAFQIGLVIVMIIIPLIYTDTVQMASGLHNVLAAPPPPPPPPPAPPPATIKAPKRPPRRFDGTFYTPRVIPKVIADIEEAPPSETTGIDSGIPPGIVSTSNNSIPTIAPPPPPKVTEAKAITPQRIRQGGDVQAANLIKKVIPAYPYLAKQAHVQGTVRFTAIIGKDGTIQNLQLASGQPLLISAATEAVKQWVYRPTLLNGEPVEVITEIDINFTLSQ